MSEDESSNDLPYRAEYAKSGRSNCKGCKTSIAKDILRLAAMVQSPVYDGKVPNWYHFNCFFAKQRPKTIGDIQHFASLRYEDQEKIREKVGELSEIGRQDVCGFVQQKESADYYVPAAGASCPEPEPKAKGKGKSKKRAAANGADSHLKDFTVEYAKSSRAACRGCELKLAKVGTPEAEEGDIQVFLETEVKVKDETDGPPPEKKVKKEDAKEDKAQGEAYRKQMKKMFQYRDSLKSLKTTELTQILKYNKQDDAVGTERKLDRVADIMTCGALKRCSVCSKGQLVFKDNGYHCTGDLSEWAKCTYFDRTPPRVKCRIPEGLLDDYDFLERLLKKVILRKNTKSNTNRKPDDDMTEDIERVVGNLRVAGGRDRAGRPLVQLSTPPDVASFDRAQLDKSINYILSIFSDETKRRGLTFVVDAQKSNWRLSRMCVRHLLQEVNKLEGGVRRVTEWVLTKGEDLLTSHHQVGYDIASAEKLRREHEALELHCRDTYGQYAELLHKMQMSVQSGVAIPEDLQAQRDFMDFVIRSFATRLERRRNILISSARFYRLVSE
ncbi:unnamed protein product, partial [Nesidiocoris tenuis]